MVMKKRSASRQKTYMRAFVYFGASPLAVDCLVREMSDSGARIQFSAPPPAIDLIELSIPIKGQKFSAKVIWRAADEIGIAFVGAFVASNAETSDGKLSTRVATLEDEISKLKQLIKLIQKSSDNKTEAA